MPHAEPPARRPALPGRQLLRIDLSEGSLEQLGDAIQALLDRSRLAAEERIQLLGGALVVEALKPHWGEGRTPAQAHARLRAADPELADAVEALAPMLLARVYVQSEAAAALDAVDALLRGFD